VSERWSWAAASAARGVQDAADDATFFTYAKALFANQQRYSMDLIASLADEVGVDGAAIRADARNETYRPVVKADREEGIDRGVDSTPFVFVNRKPVGTPSYRNIRSMIDAELE
jgi:protein-disulfide isomerase